MIRVLLSEGSLEWHRHSEADGWRHDENGYLYVTKNTEEGAKIIAEYAPGWKVVERDDT